MEIQMNAKRKKSLSFLFIFAAGILLLFGCASEEPSSDTATDNQENDDSENKEAESSSADEETSEYPITIEHSFGETAIEKKPEQIATIQWGNHDVALALGVVPVGFSAANFGDQDGDGLLPWTSEKLDELGVEDPNIFQDTDGLDFEAISDSNPDVILAAYSGITQEDYDILNQIAPVVAYPTTPWVTEWREQIMLNATGMGMEAEGEQLIEDTENLIEEKLSEYPEIQGKKIVWTNFSAEDLSNFHVYTPTDPRGAFLTKEFGMEYPESVTNLITDDTGFAMQLSAENADVLFDADILIGYGGEDLYEAVKADPVLGEIPAIQNGSVVFIGDNTPLAASANPNPLSIEYTIDDLLSLISEASSKINE